MAERLVVVIGAGASFGCAPDGVAQNPSARPPLVSDLFAAAPGLVSTQVLERYELASLAAAELSSRTGSVAVEELIRERYRDSPYELDRRIFNNLAPYLQELLYRVGAEFTRHPRHYQALAAGLLRLPDVTFVTLNYDLIFDRVLAVADTRPTTLDWYVDDERPWALIKLHGSVNWWKPIPAGLDRTAFYDPPARLDLGGEIASSDVRAATLSHLRGFEGPIEGPFKPGSLRYPILSVPQGANDELACPPGHVEYLRAKLRQPEQVHLLFIGYSGHDREVMKLLAEPQDAFASLRVIDRDEATSRTILTRLKEEHGLTAGLTGWHDGDFGHWIVNGLDGDLLRWQPS